MIFRKWLHDLFLPQVVPPLCKRKRIPGRLEKNRKGFSRCILIPDCCGGEACTAMHGVMLRLSRPDDGEVVIT
ncbi:hypothetical protein EAI25_05940 [Akkermansia muciniphila]|nr:hypothetical protein [Akkermansia muciniphila]